MVGKLDKCPPNLSILDTGNGVVAVVKFCSLHTECLPSIVCYSIGMNRRLPQAHLRVSSRV